LKVFRRLESMEVGVVMETWVRHAAAVQGGFDACRTAAELLLRLTGSCCDMARMIGKGETFIGVLQQAHTCSKLRT
jgi:hypothetical protein